MSWLTRFLSYLGFIAEDEEKKEFSDIFMDNIKKPVVVQEVQAPAVESTLEKAERKMSEKEEEVRWATYFGNILEGYNRLHGKKMLGKRDQEMESRMPTRTPIHQWKVHDDVRKQEQAELANRKNHGKVRELAMAGYGK